MLTVTGDNFTSSSVVIVGGASEATTYVSTTQLTAMVPAAQLANGAQLTVAVSNGAANGSTVSLDVDNPAPVIASVFPTVAFTGTASGVITLTGSGFVPSTVIDVNGSGRATTYISKTQVSFVLLSTDVSAPGNLSITAVNPVPGGGTSTAVTLAISNAPAPTIARISPAGGPINAASAETLIGTGFTANTTVSINGSTIASTVVSSTEITANFPAYALATPGNQNVTVSTPAPGGGTSPAQVYTTFLSIPNNDLVYNAVDGLLYASVPASAAGAIGNCVVGIDPNTGAITRQIQVGTNPNRLALSTDGTQLFVGIDGAGAVAQVNLAQGNIVNQFSLGGGSGVYNPPHTAAYMAAVPGLPNSVAVAMTSQFGTGIVTIFDSGVARSGSSTNLGEGPLSFGSSASTLYLGSSYIDTLAVGSNGITGSTELTSNSYNLANLQYDNGALYVSSGQVLNAATGALNGTFYSAASTQANGPIVSDSTLGRAFVAISSFSNTGAVYIFDETSFNLLGTIPVNDLGIQGYPTNFRKIVRWGQNGIAVAAIPSAFTSNNQIYIFQSPLVKDVSSSPADLGVSFTAPATAATGTAISYVGKVTNSGPNAAVGVTLFASLDPSLIINSVTASQGSCTTAAMFSCDLGGVPNGATVTVTVMATPSNSGTLAATASISSSSYDPTPSNNQATTSTTVTGALYSAVPSISSISPNLVQAGSGAFLLTVNGTGFSSNSTVNLGNTALATTYVNSTRLTAMVAATAIASYGWAPVIVSNAAPGGGSSGVVPLTIYDLVNVPANAITFDQYSQSLYATIPGSATGITGNSLVAINPFTGSVGTPVAIGSQPTVMAETLDGNYLYVGLTGSDSLAQFDLIHQSVVATIPISYTQFGNTSNVPATYIAAMPGTDSTLAMDFTNTWSSFGIFDINGNTGTFRPNLSGISEGVNPVWASATELYAYDSLSTGAEFYRYNVNSNGLTLIDGTTLDGMGGFSGGFVLANGLVYGRAGGIANPFTTPPSQIQTLPSFDFYDSGDVGPGVGAVPDPSLQKEFLMLDNIAGISAYALVRYDLTSYLPETLLIMPGSGSDGGSLWTMLRFGQDGLALFSSNSVGPSSTVVQLMLIKGPFVAPQELSTHTAASLTSSSASSISHGAGNTILTLTGSNFLPGVAVTWNGSYRTTTIVDANHVTVAIPASDLSTSGTASVEATNFGASPSNALQITIN